MIDERVQQALSDEIFTAAAIAVIHRGELVLNKAWRHHPNTPDSLFDLASVTKLFTTTVFLQLVSEGKTTLDTPLVEVIPEFGTINPRPVDGGQDPHTKEKLPTPPKRLNQTVDPAQVTFWHLLTHLSGLPPWRDVYTVNPTPPSPTEPDPMPRETRWSNGIEAMCKYPFVAQPGEEIRYSDIGLMLLGEAASRLHGNTLENAVQTRVVPYLTDATVTFNPMKNGISREQIAPTEIDSTWRKRRVWGEVHDENACGLGGVAGHAGLFANALTIANFGEAWRTKAIGINPEWIQQATSEQVNINDNRRGLGWMLKSTEDSSAGDKMSANTYGHTGFTGTSLSIDPDAELVVATLTNRVYPGREKPGIHAFRRAIHDQIHTAIIT